MTESLVELSLTEICLDRLQNHFCPESHLRLSRAKAKPSEEVRERSEGMRLLPVNVSQQAKWLVYCNVMVRANLIR